MADRRCFLLVGWLLVTSCHLRKEVLCFCFSKALGWPGPPLRPLREPRVEMVALVTEVARR